MSQKFTTVINLCGGEKYYSFLPPHGANMKPSQSITYIGDVVARLVPGWPYNTDKDRPPNRTKLAALHAAERNGQIMVLRFTSPKLNDSMTKAFRNVNTLCVVDPNYKSA